MDLRSTTLDFLQRGQGFEVIHLSGSGEIKKRLLDMGFIPGAKGVSLHKGPFNDPIEILIGAYKISIRKNEAKSIHIIKINEIENNIQRNKSKLGIAIEKFFQKKDFRQEIMPPEKLADSFYLNEKEKLNKKGKSVIQGKGFREYFSINTMLTKESLNFRNRDSQRDRSEAGKKLIRIAIAGNPNTGKSSLFNVLTGSKARVGNYPGVTVDTKKVRIKYKGYQLEFIDLPGTYSLSAYSFEEVVSRDFIIFQKPDVVLDVLDATNLERNLYLCLQFQELGVPLVGALNMIDEAEKNGILIDVEHLSDLLQIPFVKTSAYYKRGMEELMEVLLKTALDQREILKLAAQNDLPFGNSEPVGRHLNYGRDIEKYHNDLIQFLSSDASFAKRYSLHWMAIKLIENDSDALKKIKEEHMEADIIIAKCELIRQSIFIEFSMEATSLVAQQRYGFIRGAIREAVNFTPLTEDSLTEKLDRFALHKHLGMVIFFAMMYLIYYLTFTIGNYLSDYVALLFKFISEIVSLLIPQGIFQRFLVEGIIGGVGGVIVFLPIILLIFAGLSFLEDSGYLARASFVMDRFMHQFKMHGRSFIPLMISTGCAVPAVMSTRALASQKDRIITAMVLPMMMCTAKTPVVAMLVGVFFINHAGVVFWLIWFFAWLVALFSALFLNKTVFQGDATPFVMELPPYRFPTLFGIMKHMWDKAMGYLKKAGTIILAASIITWIVFNFPKKENLSFDYISQKEQITQQIKELKVKGNEPDKFKIDLLNHKRIELENRRSKEEIGYSIGGRIGMFIEPFFALMGFDWKMSVSILAALPAKEIVVSTMGVVYGIGELAKETDKGEGGSLKEAIRHDPNYNPLTIISFLIFVMLYSPCFATLAVIKRELGGWRWVFFSMIFSFSLASILAIMVYQLGKILI